MNHNSGIELEHAKIELDHFKKIKAFRTLKNEIETIINELKSKSKSVNWKYLEEICEENKQYKYISEIETYHKIFYLDFIIQKFNDYDKLLIKNIENIIEEHKSAREVAKTLCEMNSLDLTLKNYDSDSESNTTEDEGFPLVRTHGRATPLPKKHYNLRPRK